MSFNDRDYNRVDRGFPGQYKRVGTFALPRLGSHSVVTWLLIINIAVFFLDAILERMGIYITISTSRGLLRSPPLYGLGHFSAALVFRQMQLWRLVTFQFLHANFNHILMNMLGLYFLGPMIEVYLGSKRFLWFYLLCGIAGALAYLVLLSMGVLASGLWTPLVGASAGIFGILVAAAWIAPDTKVLLMFILPVPLRVVLWGVLGLAIYTVLKDGPNAGGQAAHLGGAALGFLLIKSPDWLNFADRLGGKRASGGSSLRFGSPLSARAQRRMQRQQKKQAELDAQVDRILAKVKASGLHSLTAKEKRILQKATHQQKH